MSNDRVMRSQSGEVTPPAGAFGTGAPDVLSTSRADIEYDEALGKAEDRADDEPESAQAWALIALARATRMQSRGR